MGNYGNIWKIWEYVYLTCYSFPIFSPDPIISEGPETYDPDTSKRMLTVEILK